MQIYLQVDTIENIIGQTGDCADEKGILNKRLKALEENFLTEERSCLEQYHDFRTGKTAMSKRSGIPFQKEMK
jgi:hypothetical protein